MYLPGILLKIGKRMCTARVLCTMFLVLPCRFFVLDPEKLEKCLVYFKQVGYIYYKYRQGMEVSSLHAAGHAFRFSRDINV